MASTGGVSAVSSARATPKGRRDTPNTAVLPKIGILSTESFSVPQSRAEEENPPDQQHSMPQAGTKLPAALTGPEGELSFIAQPLAPREMELDIKEPKGGILPAVSFLPGEGQLMAPNLSSSKAGSPSKESHSMLASVKASKDERFARMRDSVDSRHPRVKTWPSLQYKLWIDTSNLSLYRLTAEHRIARPSSIKSRQPRSRVSATVTARVPCSNGGTILREENSLSIGSTEKWRVRSSQARKTGTYPETKTCLDAANSDLCTQTAVPTIPRLPSRMGRNSFGHFLENSNNGGYFRGANLLSRVNPRLKSPMKTTHKPVAEAKDALKALTSQHDSQIAILKLKGLVRNPAILEQQNTKKDHRKLEKETNIAKDPSLKKEQHEIKKKKHLSFAIPSGSEFVGVDGNAPRIEGAAADILLHTTQLHLDDSVHIMKYVSTKT